MEKQHTNSKNLDDLTNQVKDLEAMLNRKQILIDYLEKMIDLAAEDLSIDIKKYGETSCSDSSKIV